MAATPTDVRNLSLTCEFDDLDDAKIQPLLDEAALHISEEALNVDGAQRYDPAHALLAAHLIVLAKTASRPSKGALTGTRLGPAARTYAKPESTSRTNPALRLSETGYGQRFQALIEATPLTPLSLF